MTTRGTYETRDLQGGETRSDKPTGSVERGAATLVIKGVTAQIWENYGEYYLDEVVAGKVYAQAEEAVQRRAEVEILRYAA